MEKPMNVDRPPYDLFQPQLFLDDTWIEDSAFVVRQWHQPRKYPQPVLTAEHPWERWCPLMYGTVLYHGDRFKMWYCVWTRGEHKSRVCYAESRDGVAWEKPFLGLCEFEGSKDNNIVLDSIHGAAGLVDCISVIDDTGDEEWPLKALYWDGMPDKSGVSGICAGRSRDGIHWDRSLGCVLPNWDDRHNVVSRKIDGEYILYGRAPIKVPKGRSVWRTTSRDLQQWSEPELVLSRDVEDPPHLQYYSAAAFPYSDLMIAGLERMWLSPDRVDTEIVWSRNAGRDWHRARTRPSFIPWGAENSWDSTWLNLPSNGPVEHKKRLWFYYSGRSGAHGVPYPFNHGNIGLALLRIDGFASLRGEDSRASGWVLTPPLEWPDAELYLNLDPRSSLASHPGYCDGEIAVEVRDEANAVITGFSWDECLPMRDNTADKPKSSEIVRWREKSLSSLAGRCIRLAFRIRYAHLYSFQAGPAT
jgi:hypothetical protein